MSLSEAPRTPKWPYLLADVILVATAAAVAWKAAPVWTWKEISLVGGLTGLGAWIFIQPFQKDHETAVKLFEQVNLASAAEKLGSLDKTAQQIAAATAQWQDIQTLSNKTVNAAGDITQRIAAEAKSFSEFLARANDGEKANLRLEIEKLRRGEKDSLQVVIHLMDHCFALFQAAMSSGQPQLIQQIGNYRNACIDATRRGGILPYEAQPGEPFDADRHEVADGSKATEGATVERTIAWGYTFQGAGIRRIQVALASPSGSTASSENT
jgi:molecular chaperone GrpE (heat shock protein)